MSTIETWAVRVSFGWRGPKSVLAELREYGTLRRTGRGEYAFTVALRVSSYSGTLARRQDRAAWIAQETLHLLLDTYVSPHNKARWFTQWEIRHVDPRRVAAGNVARRRERKWARAHQRRYWEAIRWGWPTRSRDMAAYRRRRQARGRRR